MIPTLLAALLLQSQDGKPLTTNAKMEETVKVTVTGEVELDYVWRRQEITAMSGGVSGTSSPGNSESENTFEGFVALRMTIDLSDQISTIFEIGTKRVDAGAINPYGLNAAGALPIQLREAVVIFKEFLWPELRMELGISRWNFDVRGRGSSFAFDPRHSQSFARNISAGSDGPGTLAARASDPQELEPAGLWLRLARTLFTLDLVALPAVIEGGSAHNDESFYALDLLYKFGVKESQIGLIVAVTNDPGHRSTVYTYGGGLDWKGTEDFDIYGEFYFQNGSNSGIKVGGHAFQLGAEYSIPGDVRPWVELNFTYMSGDGSPAPNGKSSAFNSYENIADLLILEDMYTGFDWDSNYRAVKLSGGVRLHAQGKNDLKLRAIFGYAQTVQPVRFASGPTHRLGNEIDLTADLALTKQVTINFGIGFLFGSKVLLESMGGKGANDAERHTILFTLGTDLKF